MALRDVAYNERNRSAETNKVIGGHEYVMGFDASIDIESLGTEEKGGF